MLKRIWITSMASIASLLVLGGNAFAEAVAASNSGSNTQAAIALSAGFGLALAAFGGAISQSKAATAALEGIARNPGAANKVFVPMLLGLALIESLVIYSLVISFSLLAKF